MKFLRAVDEGDLVLAEKMLKEGQDPDVANSLGETAIMIAAREFNSDDSVSPEVNGYDTELMSEEEFLSVTRDIFIKMAELLIKYHCDINAISPSGNSALLAAINDSFNSHLMVEFLLSNGANPNLRLSNPGLSNLMWASCDEIRSPKIVKLLLEHGADKEAIDQDGNRAIDYAIKDGMTEIVKLLE